MSSRTITLDVEGMSCGHCSATVKKAIAAVDRVSDVTVDLEKKKAYFKTDDESSVQAAVDAVNNAGYKASPPV